MARWGIGVAAALALAVPGGAAAYPWPLKPFDRAHPVRGAFDDPRFHMGAEAHLSAFHSGIDIAARDGTPVYSVARGVVRSATRTHLTVAGRGGRAFGYWHVRPVVRSGQRVRKHQLLGRILPGWGHVHFSETIYGQFRNPLRPRALTPFRDRTPPTVASVLVPSPARGVVDVASEVYDTPPVLPARPWHVARLTPATIWWRLSRSGTPLGDWMLAVDFHFALMPGTLYDAIYAPGSYQNKGNRPGRYLFWIARGFDTTLYPDGRYRIDVLATDTRGNVGTNGVDFTIANDAPPLLYPIAPGMSRAR